MEIALFPLNTVLFPGGPLRLRIFERRYLDLVSRCLRADRPFGICLIREGREVGGTATPHPIGTLARIVDWDQRPNGLLGITALGEQRFRIHTHWRAADGLNLARVAPLAHDTPPRLPAQPEAVTTLVERLLGIKELGYAHCERHDDDPEWLAGRIAEALPLDTGQRQALLAIESPLAQLRALQRFIPDLVLPDSTGPTA